MADDANFCGHRLRLATFLRVVENGMPQRPARCRRRMRRIQPVEEQPHEPPQLLPAHARPSDVMCNANAQDETAASSLTALKPCATQDLEKSGNPQDTEASQDVTSAAPKPCVRTWPIYAIPRSPTPDNPRIGPSDLEHDFDAHSRPSEARTTTTATKQFWKKAAVSRSLKVKETAGKPCASSSTRKRRLPVHGLALLRTTISDGLPEPSDADIAFAAPIAEIDPIIDSQALQTRDGITLFQSYRSRSVPSQKKKKPMSRVGQKRRTSSSRPVKRFRRSTPPKSTHSVPKQQPRAGFPFVADGFVGNESKFVSTRKPRRRENNAPWERKERKATPVVASLALVSGPLPTPVLHHNAPSIGPTQASALRTYIAFGRINDAKLLGQLTLTKDQSVTETRQGEEHHRRQWQSTIRKQLSSITAPVRSDSESSWSESIAELQSVGYKEDRNDHCDNTNEITHSYPLTHKPTVVENTNYFETALHHLDVENEARSSDGDSWC